MSNSMIVQQASKLASMFDIPDTGELVTVLKSTAFKSNVQVTDAQMSALLIVANQYGLNPWTKEIYAFPDKGGIVPVVGVDGWSRIINGNPQFDGMDFEQDDESCTCRIYRKDRSHPVAVTEYMSECKRPNVGPWQSHPKRMLRHKAMIQCARLAFGYAGIYDQDEAERIAERDMGKADVVAKLVNLDTILAEINTIDSLDTLRAKRQQWGKECAEAKNSDAWESIKAATEVRAAELKPVTIDQEAQP